MLNRLYEILEKAQKGTWKDVSQVLFPYSKDQDKKWGLRFYLLLTELLRALALEIKPKDNKNQPSDFRKQYGKAKNQYLFKEENFYIRKKLSEYPQQD